MSDYSGCCSIASNNGFLIVLIFFNVALLSSCEIDSSLTLILNMFVCRYLVRVRNPCVGCKDYTPILVGFCSNMRISG